MSQKPSPSTTHGIFNNKKNQADRVHRKQTYQLILNFITQISSSPITSHTLTPETSSKLTEITQSLLKNSQKDNPKTTEINPTPELESQLKRLFIYSINLADPFESVLSFVDGPDSGPCVAAHQ